MYYSKQACEGESWCARTCSDLIAREPNTTRTSASQWSKDAELFVAAKMRIDPLQWVFFTTVMTPPSGILMLFDRNTSRNHHLT